MNYRHHFHAGNYADVFKHTLLLVLIRALQRKEKGFLFLDTHAGRGGYDLTETALLPDGRTREPEHPGGIGRLWQAAALPPALADYVALVRRFNERNGETSGALHFYPGSPWLAKLLLRPQDRLALCELGEDDAAALAHEFRREARVTVQRMDGYAAPKALLPPPEKRTLMLIDPPFEGKGEFTAILAALRAALARLPSGVYAVWYPITERARAEDFLRELAGLRTPCLVTELDMGAVDAPVRMKGCGLLVLNPPWQIDGEIRALLPAFVEHLGVDAGAQAQCDWLVPEK